MACAAIVVPVLAAGCGDDEGSEAFDDDLPEADCPESLVVDEAEIGEEVQLAGEVTEVAGPAFQLVTDRVPDSILVVHNLVRPPSEDSVVKVTGMLDEVNVPRLEEALEVDLSDEMFERYRGDLVIAAQAVDD